MTMNAEICLVGNVVRDPELRYLTSGTALATFSLACNRRYMKGTEWVEETSFFDVIAWRDLGDNVAESLTKGDRVIVSGRLEQRSWENDAGEKRSKVEIVADDVGPSLRWATTTVTKTPKKEGNGGGGAAEQPPSDSYDSSEPF